MRIVSPIKDRIVGNYLHLHSGLILIDLDEQGKILGASQSAKVMFGADCIGKNIADLLINFSGPQDVSILRNSHGGRLYSYTTATGAPVSLFTSYLHLGSAGVLIAEPEHYDIQELQLQLLTLNSELSSMSRELQKRNVQLEHAQDMKNRFIGVAAHDLRNPLTSIYACLELIGDGTEIEREELGQMVQEVKTETTYCMNLVANLLDFTVIEQGRLELKLQTVHVHELLHHVLSMQSLQADRRGLTVKTELIHTDRQITVDTNRIRQVLQNLFSNAFKYSPKNGVVRFKAQVTDNELIITVQDDGPGIPSQASQKLFKAFGKAEPFAPSGEKNIGLGLLICQSIVNAHGGQIWEEGQPGQGACFRFTLPWQQTGDSSVCQFMG